MLENLNNKFIKHFATGLAVTLVITVGAALMSVGSDTDPMVWLHNLIVAEAGALGTYIVTNLNGQKNP